MDNKSEIDPITKMKPLPSPAAIFISLLIGCELLMFFGFGGDIKFTNIIFFIILSTINGFFCLFITYHSPRYWYIIGTSIAIPSFLLYFSLFFSNKTFPVLLFIFPCMFLISGLLASFIGKNISHITRRSSCQKAALFGS